MNANNAHNFANVLLASDTSGIQYNTNISEHGYPIITVCACVYCLRTLTTGNCFITSSDYRSMEGKHALAPQPGTTRRLLRNRVLCGWILRRVVLVWYAVRTCVRGHSVPKSNTITITRSPRSMQTLSPSDKSTTMMLGTICLGVCSIGN